MSATFLTLHEMVKLARGALTRGAWDYLMGAAETETTLKRNRLAIDRLALEQRVLNDVSEVHTAREFLGASLRIPVLLAPIGSLQVFEAGGGRSSAQAAERFGVMQVLSSVCTPDFATLAEQEPNAPKIHQLYAHGDEAWLMDIAQRTQDLGYRGFCLTVDTQVYSRRERDILKRYVPQSGQRVEMTRVGLPVAGLQPKLTWALVDRVRARLSIPLVLKGIGTAADAERAVEHGIDVIYVSNHGGRQLDQARATFDVLPEVVAAVRGRAKVVVDGGIMRGTDVLKALALGADAVGIGRLEGLAMAAGGADAVVRMLELLENEMRINLALMGLSSIDQLQPSSVRAAEAVTMPHVLSAFPHLAEDY